MKWLQGWLGALSGGLGVLLMVILSLFNSASTRFESCQSVGDGVSCTTTSARAQTDTLIVIGLLVLLYGGVLVGTWLDLGGRRRVGRLILLISASGLMLFALALPGTLNASALGNGSAFLLTYPTILLALVTAILACVRRDELRPVTAAASGARDEAHAVD